MTSVGDDELLLEKEDDSLSCISDVLLGVLLHGGSKVPSTIITEKRNLRTSIDESEGAGVVDTYCTSQEEGIPNMSEILRSEVITSYPLRMGNCPSTAPLPYVHPLPPHDTATAPPPYVHPLPPHDTATTPPPYVHPYHPMTRYSTPSYVHPYHPMRLLQHPLHVHPYHPMRRYTAPPYVHPYHPMTLLQYPLLTSTPYHPNAECQGSQAQLPVKHNTLLVFSYPDLIPNGCRKWFWWFCGVLNVIFVSSQKCCVVGCVSDSKQRRTLGTQYVFLCMHRASKDWLCELGSTCTQHEATVYAMGIPTKGDKGAREMHGNNWRQGRQEYPTSPCSGASNAPLTTHQVTPVYQVRTLVIVQQSKYLGLGE
ncbi:hypothetical protein EMCRGX_G027203 [Ephydatia muelleri]